MLVHETETAPAPIVKTEVFATLPVRVTVPVFTVRAVVKVAFVTVPAFPVTDVGAAIIACLWSRLAATVAAPTAAESAKACVLGEVASKAKRVASVFTKVAAEPAALAVPKVKAGVPPTGRDWSPVLLPLTAVVPVTERVGVAEPEIVTLFTVDGVIAPKAKVIAGVVVAEAIVADIPFAVTTETEVTVPVPPTA